MQAVGRCVERAKLCGISAWIVSTVSLLTQRHSAGDAAVWAALPIVEVSDQSVSRKREMDGAVALPPVDQVLVLRKHSVHATVGPREHHDCRYVWRVRENLGEDVVRER